jgi:sulfatase modifying factor 1
MLKPNGFGLHDIVGNVWEWTSGSPEPIDTAIRIARGGAWSSVAAALRVSVRARLRQDAREETVGVRCARPL